MFNQFNKFFFCLSIGKIIDITYSGNELKHLNHLTSTDATVFFSCRNCHLKSLASAVFIDVPNIAMVDLSWNFLDSDALRPDIFRGRFNNELYEPVSFVHLDLSHNNIATLEHDVFLHTVKLKHISLAHNPLNISDPVTVLAIARLYHLEYLDLSWVGLNELPDQLFNGTMPKLRELHIEGNQLISVPESISLLGSSLKILHIGENLIVNLNNECFLGLKVLTHLYISNLTHLENITNDSFSTLLSLQLLDVSNNLKLKRFDFGSLLVARELRKVYTIKFNSFA